MAEIIAAIDEVAATDVFHDAQTQLGTLARSGSGALGPFTAGYSATASFSGGAVDLIPTNVVRIADLQLNWSINFSFSLDLSTILPDIHIPQVCIDIPCIGEVCTPRIDIDWPTVLIPVSVSDFVKFTGDFTPAVSLVAGKWKVEVVMVGVPNLQFGLVTGAILAAISAAAFLALSPIPLIGPFLGAAVAAIVAAIGVAGVTGLLGAIVTPFVSGLRFAVYSQPQHFEFLPSGGAIDPPAAIRLDGVTAAVDGSTGEDELVLSVDISPA